MKSFSSFQDSEIKNQDDSPPLCGNGNGIGKGKRGAGEKSKPDPLEEIYDAYPRKEKPRAAKKAIDAALKRLAERPDGPADPVAWLLERTQAYAQSPAGQRGRYTPHPATWFNDGGYDSDPQAWHLQAVGEVRERDALDALLEGTS